MRMYEKALVSIVVLVGAFLLVRHALSALRALSCPKTLPAQAVFLQSGYDLSRMEVKGDWVACGLDAEERTNWCKVTDSVGTVLFEGDFLPVPTETEVPVRKLKLRVVSPNQLFVRGPGDSLVPAILRSRAGLVLVPAEDVAALAARWKANPDEMNALLTGVVDKRGISVQTGLIAAKTRPAIPMARPEKK